MLLAVLTLLLPAAQVAGDSDLAQLYGERWSTEARVYHSASPSVVSVNVFGDVQQRNFRGSRVQKDVDVGQGTGVILDASGLLITNAHVVAPQVAGIQEGSLHCTVVFSPDSGGQVLPARILNIDQEWDLALLQIEAPGPFRAIPMGRSDDLLIGEKVIAIGTAFGESHSLTSGILSGVKRDIDVADGRRGKRVFTGLLQTDAAINPGNSGGPLLNVNGELIGINNATNIQADGMGFAIPIDRVREILATRLLDVDRSDTIWAGLRVAVDGDWLKVMTLHPRGPAAKAGLQVGDLIRAVNGVRVGDKEDYSRELMRLGSGDAAELTLERDHESLSLTLDLLSASARDTFGLLGFTVERDLVQYRRGLWRERLPVLRIAEVFANTGAADLGLAAGDIVVAVRVKPMKGQEEWRPVRTLAELVALVRGPDFEFGRDNIWLLRDDASLKGLLEFDDPAVARRGL